MPWKAWLSRLDNLVNLNVYSINVWNLVLSLRPTKICIPCPSLDKLTIEGIAATTPPDFSALMSSLSARAVEGHSVSRLRFRGEDWRNVDRVDSCWERLVQSQGGSRRASRAPLKVQVTQRSHPW